jgi:outer membrane protein TolC
MPQPIRWSAPALALLLLGTPLVAQKNDTLRISLPEAVTRGLQYGDEARLASAQVELADASVMTARSSALPQLRISGNYSHVYQNARAQAIGQIFNQSNTFNTNANLSQVVFQGGRVFSAWRAASKLREASELTQEETNARLSYDIQASYLQVLFSNRILEIQNATYARAGDHLKEVERFEAAGRSSRYDVLRAKVQLANIEPQTIQARSDRDMALLELKRLINVPLALPLVLTTSIDAATAESIAASVEASDGNPVVRPSLRAAELTASARRTGIAVARADFLPQISIFLQTGFQAFPSEARFPFDRGSIIPCSDGSTSRVCQNGGWFSDRSMGIQVSWPIFDGLRAKGNYDLAQAQARVADLQLAQQRETIALEVAEARAGFQRAKSLFEARRQNTAEANEALRLANLRYGRGLSTQLEVQDAQLAVMQAETNEARSIYDYYLASAELARALGEPLPLPGVSNPKPKS